MEAFYTALETVLNINPEQAKTLVTNYNTGDLAFFETYFNALPTVKLEAGNVKNDTVNETIFIEADHIGEGGYGTVYKNRTRPYVYKEMSDYNRVNNKNSLLYLKTNFKEAIIQTLLYSDPNYGKHVCRLYKVYRNGNNCVFQMEPLEIDLDKWLWLNRNEEFRYEIMPAILLKLIEIFNYFKVRYGFTQGDSNPSNIMTVKNGDVVESLKIIDFGLSTVRFGDIQIGSQKKSKRTETKVLFIVLQYKLDEKTRKLFSKIVKQPPETPIETLRDILYSKAKTRTRKGGSRSRHVTRKSRRSV